LRSSARGSERAGEARGSALRDRARARDAWACSFDLLRGAALEQLLGERQIGLRTLALDVVKEGRFAEARALAQADVLGDHRGEHPTGEVLLDFRDDLLRE